MKIVHAIVFVVVALAAGSPSAAEKAKPAVKADTREAFAAVAADTRTGMGEGGRFSSISATEKSKVNSRLDEMGRLFDQRESVAQMSDDEKMRLFNAQEEVNSILAKRDNDRLICKSEMPIGSHLPIKTCKTVGEIERQRRADSRSMDQIRMRPPRSCKPTKVAGILKQNATVLDCDPVGGASR